MRKLILVLVACLFLGCATDVVVTQGAAAKKAKADAEQAQQMKQHAEKKLDEALGDQKDDDKKDDKEDQ